MASERIEQIPLDKIHANNRVRTLDEAWVEVLAVSIDDIGLTHPVLVRSRDDGDYDLVVGGHRLAAHLKLQRDTIAAKLTKLSDDEALLVEIDENLCRRDLNALDRAIHLAERKAVWERLHPETKHGGDRKAQKNNEDIKSQTLRLENRFTKDVAKKVGLSERSVQMSVALLDGLSAEAIRLLRLTPLADNAAQIRQLAAEDKADQVALLKKIAKGEANSLKQARVACGIASAGEVSVHDKAFQALMRAWERATPRARRQFMKELDYEPVARKPVVDRNAA